MVIGGDNVFDIKNENGKAQVYFYGDVVGSETDKWSRDDTCPTEIRDFLKANETKDLEIRINSGGGNCFGGIAIANMIKAHKGKTVAYVDGLCASIATVIASACDEVHLTKNSFFMVHNAWLFAQGNKEDLRETIAVLEKMDNAILESYAKHLKDGVQLDTIKDLMNNETWLCGEEVLEYFDFILDNEEVEAYAKVNKDFNYKNIPSLLNLEEKEEDEEEEKEVVEEEIEVVEEPKEDEENEKPKEDEEEQPINEKPIEKDDEEDIDKEEDIKEPIEEEKEEKVEEEIEEMEDNAEDVEDKVCEECGCDPCICEEITRKEQKEKLLAKAMEWTKYLQALDYINKKNNE